MDWIAFFEKYSESLFALGGVCIGVAASFAGLIMGYFFQKTGDERKRKAEVLNRRLDQAEQSADFFLEFIRDVTAFINSEKSNEVELLMNRIHDMTYTPNVFDVIGDKKLVDLFEDCFLLLKNQASLLKEYVKTKNKEDYEEKQSALSKKLRNINTEIKKRIDWIRATDPIKYYKK